MGYKRAEEILPIDLIELIQSYVDGENIYIPRKESNKQLWGNNTRIKQELMERNSLIYTDYSEGCCISDLSSKYFLSEKSIQRIIRNMKKTA
jgi:Uncharacterized conserved protein